MKYMGSLSDLKETMIEAHHALSHLDGIMQNASAFARQGKGPRMPGGMGDASTGEPLDIGALADTTPTTGGIDFGQASSVVSQTPAVNPPGGTVTKYSDGSTVITNAQGQDVTAAFTTGPTLTTGDAISSSLSDAITGLPAKTVGALSTVLTPLAVIGVCGLVAFFLFEKD